MVSNFFKKIAKKLLKTNICTDNRANTLGIDNGATEVHDQFHSKEMVKEMLWDKEHVKALRLRLGWSQSDLARRLGIPSMRVYNWEAGQETPEGVEAQKLDLIQKQADVASEEIVQAIEAEIFMSETDAAQCEIRSIKSRHLDN